MTRLQAIIIAVIIVLLALYLEHETPSATIAQAEQDSVTELYLDARQDSTIQAQKLIVNP